MLFTLQPLERVHIVYKKLLRNSTVICQWCIELCMNSRDKCEIYSRGICTPSSVPDGNKKEESNKFSAKNKKEGMELKCPILVRF